MDTGDENALSKRQRADTPYAAKDYWLKGEEKKNENIRTNYLTTLDRLDGSLDYEVRLEEALFVSQHKVVLRRELATERPTAFNSDLAGSLCSLSLRLSQVGLREEALSPIKEAVILYRELAKDRPAAFNQELAGSLHGFSTRLSDIGVRFGLPSDV